MANEDIRNAIKQSNLKHWEIADLLNIHETTLVAKLRHEMSNNEKQQILKIINNN